MNFTEDKEKTAGQKQDYIDSLRRLIEKRQSDAEIVRNEYLDGKSRKISRRPEKNARMASCRS